MTPSKTYKLSDKASIWFTGLSASGKTTICQSLRALFREQIGIPMVLLDGDEVRKILFHESKLNSPDQRLQRIGKYIDLTHLLINAGDVLPVVACINHSPQGRDLVKDSGRVGQYFEVFVDTPLELCIERDPKGIYAQAFEGKNPYMIGVDVPYVSPEDPDVRLLPEHSPGQGAQMILQGLLDKGIVTES